MELELIVTRDSIDKSVRYVRSPRQWVKITRHGGGIWTFARGYTGEVKANGIWTRGKTFCVNWADAIEIASRYIKDWE